jgi:hypothetical protein
MARLRYSIGAESVINRFHGVDSMVYVEGDDDIVFWETIFGKFADYSVKICDVGGLPEVKKYIEKIEAKEINAIVACDADFSYSGSFSEHPNVLRSYGYSIENTIISENTIKQVIRSIGRVRITDIDQIDISSWLRELADFTKDLVVLDISNHIQKSGKSIGTDNCSRFMVSSRSSRICPIKVEQHLIDVDLDINEEIEQRISDLLNDANRTEYDLLRGHFLFSASLKFIIHSIRKLGKKVTISNHSLFGALFLAFETEFDKDHSHYRYYQEVVGTIDLNLQ